MSDRIDIEKYEWFMESAQVVPGVTAWNKDVSQGDAICALITYHLQETQDTLLDGGEWTVRVNEVKYDTRIIASYWDPTSATNWCPQITSLSDGYDASYNIEFLPYGRKPRNQ